GWSLSGWPALDISLLGRRPSYVDDIPGWNLVGHVRIENCSLGEEEEEEEEEEVVAQGCFKRKPGQLPEGACTLDAQRISDVTRTGKRYPAAENYEEDAAQSIHTAISYFQRKTVSVPTRHTPFFSTL
ncbi:hypothetical protein Tsubulata_029615, partial [Turnera subulata]